MQHEYSNQNLFSHSMSIFYGQKNYKCTSGLIWFEIMFIKSDFELLY